jgi:hypothetical protein
LTADARLPVFIGVGNRLAEGKNLAIRRSFVYDESLVFTALSPHVAALDFNADDDQNAPGIQLRKQDGTVVRTDFWYFSESTAGSGTYNRVTISIEAFDPTATYLLDYQSVQRTPQDIIPVQELREVVNVGLSEDSPQYRENVDFYIVTDITAPVADSNNVNTGSVLEAPVADAGNTGAGVISQGTSSAFVHSYNRYYNFECISATGTIVGGNRVASFTYTSTPVSGGNDALPPRPLNAAEAAPTITVYETGHPSPPAGAVNQFNAVIELGIQLDFNFPASGSPENFAVADEFTFHGFGPALVEYDDRYDNTNQFATQSSVTSGSGNSGSGTVSVSSSTAFTRSFNTGFSLKVIGVAGASPSRTATFVWSCYGELGPNGTFTANEAVAASLTKTLAFGVSVDLAFGASNFVVSDAFSFIAYAPAMRYTAKDNRAYDLTNGATTNLVSSPVAVSDPLTGSLLTVPHVVGITLGSYNTDTPEGSFGTYTANQQNWYDTTYADTRTGHVLLPDNVKVAFRNQCRGDGVTGNRQQLGDEFAFTTVDSNTIDWSLVQQKEEQFETDDLVTDTNGTVTGTVGMTYIILNDIPVASSVSIVTSVGLVAVASVEITGTPFVALPVAPTVTVTASYNTRGDEPDPGQLYYFTGNFLRGTALYNTPQLVLDREEGRTLLGPPSTANHLHMANELAFDNNVFGCYFCQVADADEDGVFQQTDFKTAINATESVDAITDRVVLSRLDAWTDQLAANERANDPFAKRESLDWFGAPIGTAIGDRQTADTLRYYADNTLRVYGNSPSHGTRILAGPVQATVDVVLQSGDTVTVTVDGSFVAAALASMVAGYSDPGNTILKKNMAGFKTVTGYTPAQNTLLGDSGIVYTTDLGNGVIRVEEDTTVDTFAIDFYLISAMAQKQYVTKVVRREMANSVVALVVPSAEAGVGIIKASLSTILLGLLGRGIIGQYEDDSQNVRKFDPEADIVVFRDTADATLYHMYYAFFLRFPIKRVYGLFTVNTNDFGVGSGNP